MSDPSLLLPEHSLLLHIGPHKTGTTALQGAFNQARPRLAEFGVRYAGNERRPARAIYALTGKAPRRGEPPPSRALWNRLVREINTAEEPRVVLSSESFAAGDDTIPPIVYDSFRGRNPHLVVTLRPLSHILPSQWQQYVQNGLRLRYQRWLEKMFNEPDAGLGAQFWLRHDHGALVKRWVSAFGADNCTVVVADETDRGMLLRVFEQMAGLPEGLLVPEEGRLNRSLSYGEAELHRRLNIAFHEYGWDDVQYAKLLRHGMVAHLQLNYEPGEGAPRIVTPKWAVERAAEIGARSAATIAGLGVRVVGDLDSIGRAREADLVAGAAEAPPASLPMRAVTQAMIGLIIGSQTKAPIEIVMDKQQLSTWARVRRLLRRGGEAADAQEACDDLDE
ncbi:MAG TPA: hypothetical protein VHE57_11315 [Mycobacteriales bacterium]|nr:hypothetical protein [Mycobacteriales bacterium]